MARSARRVAQRQLLGRVDLDEVLGLALGCYVVVHLVGERRVRVVQHPEAPEGVLHEILHDPVGREQLRGGRDVVRGRLASAVVVLRLALRYIELVEPAQHLDGLALLVVHVLDDAAQDRALGEEALRHDEARRRRLTKQVGHRCGVAVAYCHQ